MTEQITKKEIKNFMNKFELVKASGGSFFKRKDEIKEIGGVWGENRVSRKILSELSRETYKENPAVQIGDSETGEYFRLTQKFKNMYIYKSLYYANTYLVGIRGTKNFGDVVADAYHIFGALKHSGRFKQDIADLKRFIYKHPSSKLIIASHSLGGSITKELLKDPLINKHVQYSISYNPASQITDLFKDNKAPNEKIHEVYSSQDPLLKLRQVAEPDVANNPNVEIKQDDPNKGLLEGHTIDNPVFVGGLIPDEIKNMKKFQKMAPGLYRNVAMIREMKKNDKYKHLLKDVKTNKVIKRWFREDWVNLADILRGIHTPCGRSSVSDNLPYPVCRPMKRVNKSTPVTVGELIKDKKNIPKLKKMIKEKEKNPKVRLNFKKLLDK